jgi:hypothetical protein
MTDKASLMPISIGVVTRGKYGQRLIDTIKDKTDFQVASAEIPEELPGFIEEPGEFLKNLDPGVLGRDLIITYSLHPDLNPEIARMAGAQGAKAVLIAGSQAEAGEMEKLRRISEEYGIAVEVHEICCTLEVKGNKILDEFASMLGRPCLEIETNRNKIAKIEVLRGAPCGSTWYAAHGILGASIEEAPSKAGLLVQMYPCRASRGVRGGIHLAADLHKRAVEEALRDS